MATQRRRSSGTEMTLATLRNAGNRTVDDLRLRSARSFDGVLPLRASAPAVGTGLLRVQMVQRVQNSAAAWCESPRAQQAHRGSTVERWSSDSGHTHTGINQTHSTSAHDPRSPGCLGSNSQRLTQAKNTSISAVPAPRLPGGMNS